VIGHYEGDRTQGRHNTARRRCLIRKTFRHPGYLQKLTISVSEKPRVLLRSYSLEPLEQNAALIRAVTTLFLTPDVREANLTGKDHKENA